MIRDQEDGLEETRHEWCGPRYFILMTKLVFFTSVNLSLYLSISAPKSRKFGFVFSERYRHGFEEEKKEKKKLETHFFVTPIMIVVE